MHDFGTSKTLAGRRAAEFGDLTSLKQAFFVWMKHNIFSLTAKLEVI